MLEFNGAGTEPAADLIKDSTEATFMADVVEASQKVPVLVDFWSALVRPMQAVDAGTRRRGQECPRGR